MRENHNETFYLFDRVVGFIVSRKRNYASSVLSSPASPLLASRRWRVILELLSHWLAWTRYQRGVAALSHLLQSSSASRFTAGAFGFLIFVKSSVQRFRIIA